LRSSAARLPQFSRNLSPETGVVIANCLKPVIDTCGSTEHLPQSMDNCLVVDKQQLSKSVPRLALLPAKNTMEYLEQRGEIRPEDRVRSPR